MPNLALHGSFSGISGSGNLTIAQSLDWTAGAMTGTGTTTLLAGLSSTMSGATDKGTNIDLAHAGHQQQQPGVFGVNSGTLHVLGARSTFDSPPSWTTTAARRAISDRWDAAEKRHQ